MFDVGTHEEVPYLVMELLKGETLRQKLRDGGLPFRESLEIGGQVARGLAAAHEHRIIHRDLKLENLFVMRDGRLKILDFGLAKLLPEVRSTQVSEALTASKQTDAGIVLGTVGYMSPEQVRGEAVDHHSDLFALGCILYEMVCGQRAFHRPTAAETMTAILKEDPVSLLDLKPEVSPTFVRIVERCLAKRPEGRFQTATDLAFALETVSGFSTTSAMAALRPKSTRRGFRLALQSAAVLVVVFASALAVWNWKPSAKSVSLPLIRIALSMPAEDQLGPLNIPAFALSPDGKQLVYTAVKKGGVRQLFLRSLDSLQGRPLPAQKGRMAVLSFLRTVSGSDFFHRAS